MKLIFGNIDAGCQLFRTLDRRGYSKHKYPEDAVYYSSCFMNDYAERDDDKYGIDFKKLNLNKTIKEMYAYDHHDGISLKLGLVRDTARS